MDSRDKLGRFVKGSITNPFPKGHTPWNKGLGRATTKEFIDGGVKIPLTKGKFTIIDEEDFERVNQYKWQLTTSDGKRFYAKTTFWLNSKKQDLKLHRFILGFGLGQRVPIVDHKNSNGLDNRKENLRTCTLTQNAQHSTKPSKNAYKGIYPNHNKWAARIKVNKKLIRKYQFNTPQEAAQWYNEMAIKHFGEFAKLNKI